MLNKRDYISPVRSIRSSRVRTFQTGEKFDIGKFEEDMYLSIGGHQIATRLELCRGWSSRKQAEFEAFLCCSVATSSLDSTIGTSQLKAHTKLTVVFCDQAGLRRTVMILKGANWICKMQAYISLVHRPGWTSLNIYVINKQHTACRLPMELNI